MQRRTRLHAGSSGAPLYDLQLQCPPPLPHWRAGDLFVLQPGNPPAVIADWLAAMGLAADPWVVRDDRGQRLSQWLRSCQLPPPESAWRRRCRSQAIEDWLAELSQLPERFYSIASVPMEGNLRLLVRQHLESDTPCGLGSGWLTAALGPGDWVAGRVRSHPAFHGVAASRPLVLIGAGSGLAGLRAHVAERAWAPAAGPTWLIFGERSREHDALLADELLAWPGVRRLEPPGPGLVS